MKIIITIVALLTFTGLSTCQKSEYKNRVYFDLKDSIPGDYLIRFSQDSVFVQGTPCGYKNLKGDTIIPIGKYSVCFSDTFKTFAIVFDDELTHSNFVAIDRNENILFDVYMFDNGPDWLEDGLFRMLRNGKIGYADENGIIIIEPKFECADQFENGIARVALNCSLVKDEFYLEHSVEESDSWFYIDKKGNEVK